MVTKKVPKKNVVKVKKVVRENVVEVKKVLKKSVTKPVIKLTKCEFCNGTGTNPSCYGMTADRKKYLKTAKLEVCPKCDGEKEV